MKLLFQQTWLCGVQLWFNIIRLLRCWNVEANHLWMNVMHNHFLRLSLSDFPVSLHIVSCRSKYIKLSDQWSRMDAESKQATGNWWITANIITAVHRPETREAQEERKRPSKMLAPWKNVLNIFWNIWMQFKNWAFLKKLFAAPSVPSWLRTWQYHWCTHFAVTNKSLLNLQKTFEIFPPWLA